MEALTEVESRVIEAEGIAGEGEKEACIVGRLVIRKKWNPTALITAMKKVWKSKYGISSRELGESKRILFRFADTIERDWVLKNQPWLFKGSLLAMKEYTGGSEQLLSSSANATIDHATFWARLYDVPISCMNESSLRVFAKQIGALELVDMSAEDLFGEFVRFKISVNITKPLLRGITIRVKGKYLWLPLKYESLPKYCLSCGIIDHDPNNCRQSFNQSLKYGSCRLRTFSSKKHTATTLPHIIVENILSRVPVKHLLRFKVVSKQWKATITDPRFNEKHLQQYKKTSSFLNLIARVECQDFKGLHVAELQNDYFHFVSALEHLSEYSSKWNNIMCNCDGLYLKRYQKSGYANQLYVVWNPSCRAYQEISLIPKQIDDRHHSRTIYGIYYNPSMMDYKVVISDTAHYAVFSCRSNKWSEVRLVEVTISPSGYCGGDGVSCNGTCYWPVTHRRRGRILNFEIICFDGKREKFKKLALPEFKGEAQVKNKKTKIGEAEVFKLTCCGGHLCLFQNSGPDEMRIMKRIDEMDSSWIEFKVQMPQHYGASPFPVCWLTEDEILLDGRGKTKFQLYNLRKNNFVGIYKFRYSGESDYIVAHTENLFLQ